MASRNESESLLPESTSPSTLPLINEHSYFDRLSTGDHSSGSAATVKDHAKHWALSVSKRWAYAG